MRAAARIVAEADGRGGTRLTELSGQAPLLVRRTGTRGPTAVVHLVGGAAGPIGGDEVSCTVAVGAGAGLRVRSSAAAVALPGSLGGESRMDVAVRIAEGGSLDWRPEPLIAAHGARHRALARIDLAPSARLLWREEIILGRWGEAPGSVATRLRVLRSGHPLLDHDLALGPDHPGSSGPAVTDGHRAVGGVLIVDPAWEGVEDRAPGAGQVCADFGSGSAAVLPLTGPAVLVAAVAEDGLALGRLLDRVQAALRDNRGTLETSSRNARSLVFGNSRP